VRCWAEIVVELDKNIESIDYPQALKPYDFLIILSGESAASVNPNFIKKGENTGYLVWDHSTIQQFRAADKIPKNLSIPEQKIAVEKFGNIVFGNLILFGAFTILSGVR